MKNTRWTVGQMYVLGRDAKATSIKLLLLGSIALFGTAILAGCNGDSDSLNAASPNQPSLLQYEWHLRNTGQSAFAKAAGTPGVDLNVANLFAQGEVGSGVNVLVLDGGVDINHPDLKNRIDSKMLYNFDPAASSSDPTPVDNDAHGTAVAGIIGATGIGVRGVAPGVTLGGARYICKGCETPANTLAAFGGAPFSSNADVINASFGSDSTRHVGQFDPTDTADTTARVGSLLEKGRQGKGAVLVKSAGNDYYGLDTEPEKSCKSAWGNDVSCGNSNFDPLNTMPQTIVVAAVNALGKKSSYSSASSALLVSGLGGESGNQENSGLTAGPAIVTTDLAGCNRGDVRIGNDKAPTPSKKTDYNPFDDPNSSVAQSLNPTCSYTATMNGTSAASPTVAGVVALMLNANPNLTWRDVRTILMKTARRVDSTRQPQTISLPDGTSYIPEPVWTRNSAGFWFDNWYGFGLVDAAAAVAMARSYTTYLTGGMQRATAVTVSEGCEKNLPQCDGNIPVGSASGKEIPLKISNYLASIEAVQLTISLGQARMQDIGIELISPSGTRSVLLGAFNGLDNTPTHIVDFTLASNAFNGESGKGTWTLKLVDVAKPDASPVKFERAMLNVMGH
ncbi:S8 family serine peptidase [Burkholderia cenocepacia]|uniref:S8 family serine peptidase n=1 Tax=Burkholderia pseudomultivorans TaxID=1207504 RepID=UPI0009BF5515